MAKHGTFTGIAYTTAWATAVLGTLVGVLRMALASEANGNLEAIVMGGIVILASWIGASGIGTLAEISRKLTQRNAAFENHERQEPPVKGPKAQDR